MLRVEVIIPPGMLGSNSPSFVGERMDLMGKGEVSLQSFMVLSFLFILPLSSSTFSIVVISNELSLDYVIPNLYPHPHQYQSTDVLLVMIFIPSAWQFRKAFSFLVPNPNSVFETRAGSSAVLHTPSQSSTDNKLRSLCATVLRVLTTHSFHSLA